MLFVCCCLLCVCVCVCVYVMLVSCYVMLAASVVCSLHYIWFVWESRFFLFIICCSFVMLQFLIKRVVLSVPPLSQVYRLPPLPPTPPTFDDSRSGCPTIVPTTRLVLSAWIHGLSLIFMDYHGFCWPECYRTYETNHCPFYKTSALGLDTWIIMHFRGLSRIIMDFHGLSWVLLARMLSDLCDQPLSLLQD